jgi:hypothetical protein
MKKMLFLIVVIAAGYYIYNNSEYTDHIKQYLGIVSSQTTGKDVSGKTADASVDSSPAVSSVTTSGGSAKTDSSHSDCAQIFYCTMVDESGSKVNFDDILNRNHGKILVLHINNANRQHCPRGDDKAHFEAITDLQNRYSDRIEVVGFNFSGTPGQIKSFKSYYGVTYDMLSIPQMIDSMEEGKRVQAFFNSIGAGRGGSLTMPAALFIKDGKIVKKLMGLSGYSELEGALNEAMAQS